MRLRRYKSEEDMPPTLGDRLMMAMLAPIVFNVSILIACSTFFKRSRFLDKFLIHSGASPSVWLFCFVLIGIPALVGFTLGVTKSATWLGHLFFTNMEHERNPFKSLLAWGFLFLMVYLIAKLFG